MNSIRISPKHGVNPSLHQCFFCGEPKGVLLFGRRGIEDAEAPREVCIDREPCDKCKGFMEQGIILIGVDADKTTDEKNPYRDGNWCVVTEDFISRAISTPVMRFDIMERRCAFLPGDVWDALGQPKARKPGARHDGPKEIE